MRKTAAAAKQTADCTALQSQMTIEAMEPSNHRTIEPSNQKSQMDQEYGLLPADARQQKMGCKEWAFQAFMSHTATSSYHVCNEFNHLNLFDHYP